MSVPLDECWEASLLNWPKQSGDGKASCIRRFIITRNNVMRRRSHRRSSTIFLLPITPIRSRSEEHTSELQSLMRISYAVFCLKKNTKPIKQQYDISHTTH